jgi:hypothetical protein
VRGIGCRDAVLDGAARRPGVFDGPIAEICLRWGVVGAPLPACKSSRSGGEFLVAVIFAPSEEVVRFCSSAGFGDHGLLLGKRLGADCRMPRRSRHPSGTGRAAGGDEQLPADLGALRRGDTRGVGFGRLAAGHSFGPFAVPAHAQPRRGAFATER